MNPGKFAALMPVAGGIVGERPIEPQDREMVAPELLPLLESPDPYAAVAKLIGQTPVWAFHGAKDDSVPVDFTRKMVKALRDVGSKNVMYTEYPEDKHLIFAKAFSEPGFLEWLAEQKK
jgi:predicted peptidase